MAHITGNQTERLVAINKLLPELEKFLRHTLANEQLTEAADTQRQEFLAKLENLNTPPQLPPRGDKKKLSVATSIDETRYADLHKSRDFITRQREISWIHKEAAPAPAAGSAPYQSKRRQPAEEQEAEPVKRESIASASDDTGIYEKIPSESGSAKYIDLHTLNGEGNVHGPPPIPERTHRGPSLLSIDENEPQRTSWYDNKKEVFINDLQGFIRNGPLKDLRTGTNVWCVLRSKRLFIFKDIKQPASQVIDMSEYDVHIENMAKSNFRLSSPGYPSVLLSAENDEDYTQWINALEKCKYEDLDDIMPDVFKKNRHDKEEGQLIEDPDYERPIDVIDKMAQIGQEQRKSPTETYVEMKGARKISSDGYVDIDINESRSPVYDGLAELTYNQELPPIPLSSDEEYLGGNYDATGKVIPTNGHIPAIHSEDAVSGSFESLSSSSEGEPPELPERKPRSSSGPPAYSVNNPYANSLDRKKSGSLGRKIEKSAFFNDPDALHSGILHQRSFLAVWKKRYCKVKHDLLMIYRNPDNEDKPAMEISLPGVKLDLCDKETWRSHSFKVSRANTETLYFAAETREQLMTWLNVLVKETDKDKFTGKDTLGRDHSKSLLQPRPSADPNDSASVSSLERKMNEEASDIVSDVDSESMGSADSEASDQEERDTENRKKLIRKRSSFEKSPSQRKRSDRSVLIDGYLYKEVEGSWQRVWCKVKAKNLEAYSSKTAKFPDSSKALSEATLRVPAKPMLGGSGFYIIGISIDDETSSFLAEGEREWKKWVAALKKYAKEKIEDTDFHQNLPQLPDPEKKGERKPRSKTKKNVKNGHAKVLDTSDGGTDIGRYRCILKRLTEPADNGSDINCEVSGGIFILATDDTLEQKILEIPIRQVKLNQKEYTREDIFVFEVQTNEETTILLGLKEKSELTRLLEVLWLQNAQIEGEKGTLIFNFLKSMRKKSKRKSTLFDSESKGAEAGSRAAKDIGIVNLALPKLNEPDRVASEGEQFGRMPRRLTKSSEGKAMDGKKSPKPPSGSKQSGGSRMSQFFRSLPRRKHKKYDFTTDTVDGMPKTQFSGTVNEIIMNEEGTEAIFERHCKISGKIFYAYHPSSDVKPVFKVPLRSATIEDVSEKDNSRFMFMLSSMEDNSTFRFIVDTEEDFDNWFNAIYMIDSKSSAGRLSSRESLLDDTKSDADIDSKPEVPSTVFSASNSTSSLSSLMSKQAKSLAGSGDEMKPDELISRKVSEEVFRSSPEMVKHSGFLYEVKITESNGVKSRTKLRRWCVLRQSWIETYNSKSDKVPIRGIAIGHHTVEAVSFEESGEKWAINLRSEDEDFVLCANNDDDYAKWMHEIKKVLKKRSRRPSDAAKMKLKSASEGIRQLLSSSSLSSLSKRDSKRNTIVLNEIDEKVVEKFTDDIESGNKISGVLSVVMVDGKLVKPKKRFCLIRDGKFCIAKRSKPQKFIKTIELSKIAILDECDLERNIFRFRLDFGRDKSMALTAVDHKTADSWMVAISMAILLERLTSPEKFPQQGEPDDCITADEYNDEFGPEINDLGLIDVSPVIKREDRGSQGSNFSSDIKLAIDRKISDGSSYLNPLSNLLEHAFSPGPYSESSTPSSREGTLERNLRKRGSNLVASVRVIEEEEREESDEVDAGSIPPSESSQQTEDADKMRMSNETLDGAESSSLKSDTLSIEEQRPAGGSVSSAVAKFEQMGGTRSREQSPDSVFNSVFRNEAAEESQVEVQLSDLLKQREDLEKERKVILDRLPELKKALDDALVRKERGSTTSEASLYEEEYETTSNDIDRMQKRLSQVDKKLRSVQITLRKRTSRIKEPFRRRSAHISPHVIV